MYLVNFLNGLVKEDGFELVDANSKSYLIGKPKKEKPIRFKILDKTLHWKLLINPDLYLGEAYKDGSVIIENGTFCTHCGHSLLSEHKFCANCGGQR